MDMPKRRLNATQRHQLDQLKMEIIALVSEYYLKFAIPIRMDRISARYSRTIRYWGSSLPEIMGQLRESGEVIINLKVNGSRDVSPGLTAWHPTRVPLSKRAN